MQSFQINLPVVCIAATVANCTSVFCCVGDATSTLMTGDKLVVISATWQGVTPGSFFTFTWAHSRPFVLLQPPTTPDFVGVFAGEFSGLLQLHFTCLQHFSRFSSGNGTIVAFFAFEVKSTGCWIMILEELKLLAKSSSWATGIGEYGDPGGGVGDPKL